MTTRNSTNGSTRKQLSDQLDRLDGILDALSEGLNQSVATAVEVAVTDAVQKALQGVFQEILTNPAVRDLFRPPVPPAPPAPPADDREDQGRNGPGAAWAWVSSRVRNAARSCVRGVGSVCEAAGRVVRCTPAAVAWSALAVGGLAATAFSVTRTRLAGAASTLTGWARGLASTATSMLGRFLPAFA